MIVAYSLLCIAALALVPLSAAGAFGLVPDAQSGLYAFLLGLPWTKLAGSLHPGSGPVERLLVAVVCMVLNGVLLSVLCRWLHRSAAGR